MFKVKSSHSYVDLFEGIIIGGSLAAAATFLFGTKKGKDLQKKLVHQYKKLGHVPEHMRQALKSALKTETAKKVKRLMKTKAKKPLKRVKAKVRIAKRRTHRKAA